ncbi:MAG: transcription termination/antitermination protein NusG [Sulfurifustis sp.]
MPKNIDAQTAALVAAVGPHAAAKPQPQWHVVWTRSNCEHVVHGELTAKGFKTLLPQVGRWSRRARLRYLGRVPMFPGYLFLHHAIDKYSYIEVCKTRGVVRMLGERWDRLGVVSGGEIEAIERILAADVPTIPYPYLRQGERVRITHGPLASAEGILVKTDPKKGLLVLSVELLRQSIAVQIDCTAVALA